MKKLPKNLIKVVKKAQASPGMNLYEISKNLEIGYRRVFDSLARAEELGLLRSSYELSNGRCVRKVFPVDGLESFDVENIEIGKASELQAYSQKLSDQLFKKHSGVSYCFPEGEHVDIRIVKNHDPMSAW